MVNMIPLALATNHTRTAIVICVGYNDPTLTEAYALKAATVPCTVICVAFSPLRKRTAGGHAGATGAELCPGERTQSYSRACSGDRWYRLSSVRRSEYRHRAGKDYVCRCWV